MIQDGTRDPDATATSEGVAGERQRLEREVEALRAQRDAAWSQLEAMRHSASWRVTWPLRRLRRLRVR